MLNYLITSPWKSKGSGRIDPRFLNLATNLRFLLGIFKSGGFPLGDKATARDVAMSSMARKQYVLLF
jgi:hypothetical protein